MAFGARNEDGKWRLCLRKGETITYVDRTRWPDIEITFSSQSRAKACADELNEKCWDAYEASRPERKRNRQESPALLMLDILLNHGAISSADKQRILEE